jgi:dolichol-phosphate mannosyltransferase
MLDPSPRLAIVVPMYNEIANAERCVQRILAVVPALTIPTIVVVVDDGSTDGTGTTLDALSRTMGGFEVVHQPNAGYGGALRRGAQTAHALRCEYVLFMDSDLTNPPEHVERFVRSIRNGADLVKGTRFSAGGDMNAVPWRRRIFSIVANRVARAFFRMGVTDCTNGFRAIRTELFLRMPLQERGFAVILEELYWAKKWNFGVESVPTTLTSRNSEQRPSLFPYRPALFWSYLRYAFRAGFIRYHPPSVTVRDSARAQL